MAISPISPDPMNVQSAQNQDSISPQKAAEVARIIAVHQVLTQILSEIKKHQNLFKQNNQ